MIASTAQTDLRLRDELLENTGGFAARLQPEDLVKDLKPATHSELISFFYALFKHLNVLQSLAQSEVQGVLRLRGVSLEVNR